MRWPLNQLYRIVKSCLASRRRRLASSIDLNTTWRTGVVLKIIEKPLVRMDGGCFEFRDAVADKIVHPRISKLQSHDDVPVWINHQNPNSWSAQHDWRGWRESSDSLLTFDSVVLIEQLSLHTAVWPWGLWSVWIFQQRLCEATFDTKHPISWQSMFDSVHCIEHIEISFFPCMPPCTLLWAVITDIYCGNIPLWTCGIAIINILQLPSLVAQY